MLRLRRFDETDFPVAGAPDLLRFDDERALTISRSILPHPSVSRNHCKISLSDDGLQLTQFGQNGSAYREPGASGWTVINKDATATTLGEGTLLDFAPGKKNAASGKLVYRIDREEPTPAAAASALPVALTWPFSHRLLSCRRAASSTALPAAPNLAGFILLA